MEQLLEQFKKLNQKEKDAILLYQSCLSYFINEITSIFSYEILSAEEIYLCLKSKDEFKHKFEEFKEIINNPKNLSFKTGIFRCISINDVEEFIKSLLTIINILDSIKNKMIIENPLTLYRGASLNNLDTILLGNGKYISTNVDENVAFKHLEKDGQPVLFKINICSSLNVIISPFKIGLTFDRDIYSENESLKDVSPTILKMLVTDSNQKGIILYRDEIEYEVISKKEINHIFVVEVNVWSRNLISKK